MQTMWLWVPHDQDTWGPPRVIGVGCEPPQPGAVYEVQAVSAADAAETVSLFLSPEPDEDSDPQGWLSWRAAGRRTKHVDTIGSSE